MSDFVIDKNGVLKKYTGAGGDIVIPSGVIKIGNFAFEKCSSLTSVVISEGVEVIGDGAFFSCENLQSVTFPESLRKIGEYAFGLCKGLREIEFPEGITDISSMAFSSCDDLKSVVIPNSIKHLTRWAFYENLKLRHCVLAPSLEDEKQAKKLLVAFGLENLALSFLNGTLETNEIILKELERKITTRSFREKWMPRWIEQQESEAIAKFLTLVKKMSADEIDFYIEKAQNSPEIRTIFMEYKNRLYSVETLEKMEEIQMEKEFGMREKTLADYRKDFKVYKDGDVYKITGCKSKNEFVRVPGNIKGVPVEIGMYAFWGYGSTPIREVCMEEGVLAIDKCAFLQNSTVQEIYIPSGVTAIKQRTFALCCCLQKITIPDSVKRIDKSAFEDSPSLTIYCSETSYARQYAEQHGIPWKPTE